VPQRPVPMAKPVCPLISLPIRLTSPLLIELTSIFIFMKILRFLAL
jgi:hypothetical protein